MVSLSLSTFLPNRALAPPLSAALLAACIPPPANLIASIEAPCAPEVVQCASHDLDCQLYAPADYGELVELGDAPSEEETVAAITYSMKVAGALADRLELAENQNVELDRARLSEPERRALEVVESLEDFMRPRVVVIATKLNVRRHPGDIDKKPLYQLEIGEVVYFCGGHLGRTRSDGGEVPWYWIDRFGDCDRSKPKEYIASREIRNGKEHWLVRWHDYDMRYTRHHRRLAREAGHRDDELRYLARDLSTTLEILRLNPWHDFIVAAAECLLGVTVSRAFGGPLRRSVLRATGSDSKASVARYLGGAAFGTVASPSVLLSGSAKEWRDQYAAIAVAGLTMGVAGNYNVARSIRGPQGLLIEAGLCTIVRTADIWGPAINTKLNTPRFSVP